jgi:hypothetical protein
MSVVAGDQYVATVADGGSKYRPVFLSGRFTVSGSSELPALMPPILIRSAIAFSTGVPGKIGT